MKTVLLSTMIVLCVLHTWASLWPIRSEHESRTRRRRDRESLVGGILQATGTAIGLVNHAINQPPPPTVEVDPRTLMTPVPVQPPVVVAPPPRTYPVSVQATTSTVQPVLGPSTSPTATSTSPSPSAPVLVVSRPSTQTVTPASVVPAVPTPVLVVFKPQMYDGLELVVVPENYTPPPYNPGPVVEIPPMSTPPKWSE